MCKEGAGKPETQHEKELRRARIRSENEFLEQYKFICATAIVPVLQSYRDKLDNSGYHCRIFKWCIPKGPGRRAMPCIGLSIGGRAYVRFTADYDSHIVRVTHDMLISRFSGEVETSSQVFAIGLGDLTRTTVEEEVVKYVEERRKTVQPIRPAKTHM
jgi:hypothetical protein